MATEVALLWPKLNALRLLLWQLSLPGDARDSLSKTAEKAGLGKCAFLRTTTYWVDDPDENNTAYDWSPDGTELRLVSDRGGELTDWIG